MQMVKVFLKVLNRHKKMIIMYIVIFSILMVFSVNNIPDTGMDENSYYRLGYVDRSEGILNSELLNYLDNNFRMNRVKDDVQLIKDSIISYYYDYILIIEEDGGLKSYSRNDNAGKAVIDMKINEYMSTAKAIENLDMDITHKEMGDILSDKVDVEYTTAIAGDSAVRIAMNRYYQYSSYIIMALIFTIIALGNKNFNDEKIIRRLTVSKISPMELNGKLFISMGLILLMVWIIFTVLAIILFKEQILNDKGYKLMISMFLFMIPISILGFLMTSISNKLSIQNAMQNSVSLILSFISGVFVPAEFLPDQVLKISSLMPPYWYIKAIEEAMFGNDLNELLKCNGILLLMALAFLSLKMILDRRKFTNEIRDKE